MISIQNHNFIESHHRNRERRVPMNYYITNMETHKLELHFEKEDYLALPENLKKEINRNFLFSRKFNAWVSRQNSQISGRLRR